MTLSDVIRRLVLGIGIVSVPVTHHLFIAPIHIQLDQGPITVPKYPLKPARCSKYVRLAASDMFNMDYAATNAWHRTKKDKKIHTFRNTGKKAYQELRYLIQNRQITPGMVLCMYVKKSSYNGEGRSCTHNIIYLGTQQGEPMFAQQWGLNQGVYSIRDIIPHQYPVAVVAPSNYKSPSSRNLHTSHQKLQQTYIASKRHKYK